jgi:carboxymethylenebutenolidase
MGSMLKLKASDGHQLDAYLAKGQNRYGGIVVIQEIFGVNSHIRNVADGFAKEGYVAIAPALFDRYERNYETGYQPAEIERGRGVMQKASFDKALADVAAAAKHLMDDDLSVAVVGYCWGGSLAWGAAEKVPGLSAAVSYYGGKVLEMTDLKPTCPVMLHFGETDAGIPIDKVRAFMSKRSDVQSFVYPAGHGFNCDQRGSYHKASAEQALERTLAFLSSNLGN